MATGAFAIPTLTALAESSVHQLLCVVSRPVRPGPGRRSVPPSPVIRFAEQFGVELLTPETVNAPEVQAMLGAYEADLFFVCDYGEILRRSTLRQTHLGGINLHGSLLPAYRGAAPVAWAVIDGLKETGISVIHMTPQLDAGPILATRSVRIGEFEYAGELEARLAVEGVPAVMESLELLARWDGRSPIGRVQDPSHVTLAPRLTREHGVIRWEQPSSVIHNWVRGLQPWPGAFTYVLREGAKPVRLQILQARPWTGELPNQSNPPAELKCGTVRRGPTGEFLVATGSGWLHILTVQAESRRAMSGAEFLRGLRGDQVVLGPLPKG